MRTLLLFWVLWAPISCLVPFLILGPFSPIGNNSLARAAYLLIWVSLSGIVLIGLWTAIRGGTGEELLQTNDRSSEVTFTGR